MNEKILRHFATYIERELGIVYQDANFFQLEHRLGSLAKQLGHADLDAFYRASHRGFSAKDRELVLDVATNNETSFFRDAVVFRAFGRGCLDEVLAGATGPRPVVRIWSAASSSGQEAYSIAMEAQARRETGGRDFAISMLVSDVSTQILRRAEEGIYTRLEIQRGLPAPLLAKHFEALEGERWRVRDSLREGLAFRRINLLESLDGIGPFDVVFCRNVLIYQSVENKKKVLGEIAKRLNPGGWLILGAAESLIGLSADFAQRTIEGAVVYQKKSA